jgi:anaerobic magnesium-protoporphyrin IX monomethyl ester cyclase
MNILFANIPFVKYDSQGNIYTGPNAGSRWPWTNLGLTDYYACFPFFMGYAVNYLIKHGVDAKFYDGVALKHWNYEVVKSHIAKFQPDILFLETSTPLFKTIKELAIWAKESFNSRIVLVGPHIQAYANELINESFVDNCVVGEYEKPALDIVLKLDKAKSIYTYEHIEDINLIRGENFLPFRPIDYLYNYWEPTMNTPRPQLQVNTSRGCPFKCTYCQWPKVMNNGQYRNRLPELVIDEIKTIISERQSFIDNIKKEIKDNKNNLLLLQDEMHHKFNSYRVQGKFIQAVHFNAEVWRINNLLSEDNIQSILFDDDTWNLGSKRITELCKGLKDIGLPWTMMGRIDTTSLEIYDLMVKSGCVGMRFGVESFNQKLLDNTKKNLSAKKSYENIKYLITRFSGMEFHFTTMKNLPGETEQDWENDLKILNELKEIGAKLNNNVHWQNSDCVAFPGTELWEEMVALGKGEELKNLDLYDGSTHNNEKLAGAVGWLGADYQPKWSKYSQMGEPTNLPSS